MMAKATNEPHVSPVKLKRSTSKDVYEPWEMTDRERELTMKYIKLIQGRIPSKEPILMSDVSPGEDTMADLSASMMSSVISSSSQESVYERPSDYLEQVTLPACLSAPASSGCPRSVVSSYFYLDGKNRYCFSRLNGKRYSLSLFTLVGSILSLKQVKRTKSQIKYGRWITRTREKICSILTITSEDWR